MKHTVSLCYKSVPKLCTTPRISRKYHLSSMAQNGDTGGTGGGGGPPKLSSWKSVEKAMEIPTVAAVVSQWKSFYRSPADWAYNKVKDATIASGKTAAWQAAAPHVEERLAQADEWVAARIDGLVERAPIVKEEPAAIARVATEAVKEKIPDAQSVKDYGAQAAAGVWQYLPSFAARPSPTGDVQPPAQTAAPVATSPSLWERYFGK